MEEIYPCTPLQEGMLAEKLLDPGANVEQLPLLFRGSPAEWRAAWEAVTARHAALRTRLAVLERGWQASSLVKRFAQVVQRL